MELKDWKRNKMMEEIIEFSKLIGRLKRTERTGWKTWVKIENPESVAEHIFRTAVLGMVISDIKKTNTEKIVRMILLHDLTEAIMGDWDYFAKKKLGMKRFKEREKESIEKIISVLPEQLKEEYKEIWDELFQGESEEAKLVEQIDKLEMMIQALEYEKQGYDKERLDAWWRFHKEKFKDPDLKRLFELLKKER